MRDIIELAIFSDIFHLKRYLDTRNLELYFLAKHLSGKKWNFVGLSYPFKFCWILTSVCFACNSWKTTIYLFHPVNNGCIVRKRNYNNCIIVSIALVEAVKIHNLLLQLIIHGCKTASSIDTKSFAIPNIKFYLHDVWFYQ